MRSVLLVTVAAMVAIPSASMAQDRQRPQAPKQDQSGEMRRAMHDPDYVFDRMDTNGDGVISKAEFRSAHAKVRARMSERHERRVERRQVRPQ